MRTSPHLVRYILVLTLLLCLLLFMWTWLPTADVPEAATAPRFSTLEQIEWERMFHDKVPYNPAVGAMKDPRLVAYLRESFLLPPPPSEEPLNLTSQSVIDQSMGQTARIREILGDMTGGFFVECGALDGEIISNTLALERQLDWSGLLIEADPLNYALAVTKKRKVHLSNSCLSIRLYPMMVSFLQNFYVGKIEEDPAKEHTEFHSDVQCFPLFTYLLAMNRTTIDYFSLDVEGNELEVLETIPWDKVNIRTLSVEYMHVPRGKSALRSYMESKGYYVDSDVSRQDLMANDYIFVKEGTVS